MTDFERALAAVDAVNSLNRRLKMAEDRVSLGRRIMVNRLWEEGLGGIADARLNLGLDAPAEARRPPA